MFPKLYMGNRSPPPQTRILPLALTAREKNTPGPLVQDSLRKFSIYIPEKTNGQNNEPMEREMERETFSLLYSFLQSHEHIWTAYVLDSLCSPLCTVFLGDLTQQSHGLNTIHRLVTPKFLSPIQTSLLTSRLVRQDAYLTLSLEFSLTFQPYDV